MLTNNVMSSPNQYLVYTALVLGSIGAYGTLNTLNTKNSSVEDLLSGVDVSSMDLTGILGGISNRLDDVESTMNTLESTMGTMSTMSAAESTTSTMSATESTTSTTNTTDMGTRLSDVEGSLDTLEQNFVSVNGIAAENTSDIAFITPDFQEQITTNKTAADAIGTTADTNLSTITDIINPDLEVLFGNITDLQEVDVGLDTRIGVIEGARILEATARSTMSGDIGTNATDITTNLESIGAIETALEEVYTAGIDANEANIIANRDDHAYLTDAIRRVEEVDDAGEVVDEYVVCDPTFRAAKAEIALSGNPLRLGNPTDTSWQLYKANEDVGNGSPRGFGFGNAMRMRVSGGSSSGFLVENHNDEALFSVRGEDAMTCIYGKLKIDTNAYIHSNANGEACFSYNSSKGWDTPAIRQSSSGATAVSCPDGSSVYIKNGTTTMLSVKSDKTTIHKEILLDTEDSTLLNSHFNYLGNGTNWISAKSSTNFRFGTNALASVVIKDKEVYIDGVGVLEKLNALEARIADYEKNGVKKNSEINLKNVYTNQFIYVVDDDKACEARGEQSSHTRARFTVNLR